MTRAVVQRMDEQDREIARLREIADITTDDEYRLTREGQNAVYRVVR